MAILRPTFSLAIGSVISTTDNPVTGPKRLIIERDMDIPVDALQLYLIQRAGVSLDDEVVVELGHDSEEEAVFTGCVTGVRPTIVGVEIRALGKLNRLLNLHTAATFQDQTAGRIARDLIEQAGLSTGTVDDGPTLPRYAIDNRLNAFEHLKDLADRLGYELYADRHGNVMFHALGPAANLDATVGGFAGALSSPASLLGGGGGENYIFGQHLLNTKANRQPIAWGTINVGGESPMSRQGDATAHWLTVNDTDYRGSAGDEDPTLLVLDPAARTKDLADRFAAGRLAVAARQAHQVQITVPGRAQVDLGDTISISDLPDELSNGSGYVRAICHRFGEGVGFVTEFRISVSGDR